MKTKILSFIFFFVSFVNLFAEEYQVNEHYILRNGQPFVVKGVVYVPCYPGFLPWDLARQKDLPQNLQSRISEDIQAIKDMGANTIRLWDAPVFTYQAIQDAGDLAVIQTIWFEVDAEDFQDAAFKEKCKTKIKEVLDKIYSVYSKEESCPILAYLFGNELSEGSILRTNLNHSEINQYQGRYVSAPLGSNATECFLAEMADFFKSYEWDTYGRKHLVSYANEVRTYHRLDTPFLDFRCFNAYSYALWDYGVSAKGSVTGSLFQGWMEELKAKYPQMPLLITETGLSVSPKAKHIEGPNYGYGGNTPEEQAQALEQRWIDITTARPPLAGICIHEYLDAWWKFSLEDSQTQDPNDVEEWFGLTAIEKTEEGFKTGFRPAYFRLQNLWRNSAQELSPSQPAEIVNRN